MNDLTLVVNKLYAHVLLDRSGSMASIRQKAVDAYNEYCDGLGSDIAVDAVISLTTFDSAGLERPRNRCAPAVARIGYEEFQPRASTPLYDAIGSTIDYIRQTWKKGDERVALVILTDGQENASREYTAEAVKALVKQCEADGWLIIYLGANQDAFAQSAAFGASSANTMDFSTKGTRNTMSAAARYTRSYSVGGQANAGFTTEERARAMKDDD